MSRTFLFFLTIASFMLTLSAQETPLEQKKIIQTCLNYIEGFYEGDSTKIIQSIYPNMYKLGYWKNKDTGIYESDGTMSYQQAIAYANNVLKNKRFAQPDAPKKVEVLDIGNHIAAAKITAWWGVDYVLLSKLNDSWRIEEVLWEGPLATPEKQLEIAYLGNMGVLLSSGDKVVLIDALHSKYKPEYAHPTENTIAQVMNGSYNGFGRPKVALVTHKHRDHFDSFYYGQFMDQNKDVQILGPKQVIDAIHTKSQETDLVHQKALKAVAADSKMHTYLHNGVHIRAFLCPHINKARHAAIQNIGYLVDMGKHRILHVGDTSWEFAKSELGRHNLLERELDVAILPYWMLSDQDTYNEITNVLSVKRIIATHIPPHMSGAELERLKSMGNSITPFHKLNQRFVLE